MNRTTILCLMCTMAFTSACGEEPEPGEEMPGMEEQPTQEQVPVEDAREEERDARELMTDARETLEEMRSDGELWTLVQEAHGVFLLPDFGRAAVVAGARAGEGVLLVRENDTWSNPVFYDLGGLSVGAQLGASGGEVAMVLMSDEAVDAFRQEDNFSVSADAGYSLIDYSEWDQARTDDGDFVLWSDTEGLFAGVSLSVSDIHFDSDENAAFYGREVAPAEIIAGEVEAPEGAGLQEDLRN